MRKYNTKASRIRKPSRSLPQAVINKQASKKSSGLRYLFLNHRLVTRRFLDSSPSLAIKCRGLLIFQSALSPIKSQEGEHFESTWRTIDVAAAASQLRRMKVSARALMWPLK